MSGILAVDKTSLLPLSSMAQRLPYKRNQRNVSVENDCCEKLSSGFEISVAHLNSDKSVAHLNSQYLGCLYKT